ncbi:MAG: hypothetical protein ACRD9R_08600 [Pyrinomonadaceae bacterium]
MRSESGAWGLSAPAAASLREQATDARGAREQAADAVCSRRLDLPVPQTPLALRQGLYATACSRRLVEWFQ